MEEQVNQAVQEMAPKRENPCEAAWGNCDPEHPEKMAYFGKPTDTPHTCIGGRKHKAKLHKCEKCGFLGCRIKPLKTTRAGQEMIDVTVAAAKERLRLMVHSIGVRMAEEEQRAKDIKTTAALADALAEMEG